MKKSLMSGAIILMGANAVSKILGAVLKIPLTYIMHEEGMAIYNTAFSVYAMVLSFAVSGIPFAVTKHSAEYMAMGDRGRSKGVVSSSVILLGIIGAVCSLILWFGADFFAAAMKEPKASHAIRAIAPSVFLVALGDAPKSGFQGDNHMLPTAVSQCIEAVIKLVAGFLLAVEFMRLGCEMAASGAILGVTIGELCATLMLGTWFYFSVRKVKIKSIDFGENSKKLIGTALPVFFMAITGAVISLVDTSLLRGSLLRAGIGEAEARRLYGAYSGYAMTVLNLPSGFLATLGVAIIPIISGAMAVGNGERIKSVSRRGLVVSALLGFLSAAVLALWGRDILQILFHNTNSARMLKLSAPSVMFICIMQLSGAILQAMGYMSRVFISSLIVGIIKLLSALFLVSIPQINIYGAAIGSDIAYLVGMIINLVFICVKSKDIGT